MKLFVAPLVCLCVLSVAIAQPPERGRVYLDHVSLLPPPNWAQHVFGTSVMYIAPLQSVGAPQCSINIGAVGNSGGGPLELIAAIDNNTPGNLLREPVAPPRTMGNGWQVAERIYRNPYVPQKFKRVAVVTRQGRGQMVAMDYEPGNCSAVLDAMSRTLQVNNEPQRLQPSGSPLALLPPIKPQPAPAGEAQRTANGEARRAEEVTHQRWVEQAQAEQRRQQDLWKPAR